MISLSDLDQQVGAVVSTLWPRLAIPARFAPLVSSALGDVGSDIAIRLAALTTEHPEHLAAKILSAWSAPAACAVEANRGYLNVRFLESQDIHALEPASPKPAGIGIVLPSIIEGQRQLSYLRLALAACAQYGLARGLGQHVRFFLGEKECSGTCVDVCREILCSIDSPVRSLALPEFVSKHFKVGSDKVTVWLHPQSLPRQQYTALCASVESPEDRLRIETPLAPWLDFRGHSERPAEFLTWPNRDLQALTWHLCEPVPGTEIDFFVPRSPEDANLRWYWQAVCERGKRILSAEPEESRASELPAAVSPLLRSISLRRRYLFTFIERAAWHGEVTNLAAVAREMLSSVSRVLNSPEFRIQLSRKDTIGAEYQILAGAVQILSASITVCDFEEGNAYGSNAGTTYKTDC